MRALDRAHFLLQVDTFLARADSRSPRPPSPFNHFQLLPDVSRRHSPTDGRHLVKVNCAKPRATLESPHLTVGLDNDEKPTRAQRPKTFQQLTKDGSMSVQLTSLSPGWVACAVQARALRGRP